MPTLKKNFNRASHIVFSTNIVHTRELDRQPGNNTIDHRTSKKDERERKKMIELLQITHPT